MNNLPGWLATITGVVSGIPKKVAIAEYCGDDVVYRRREVRRNYFLHGAPRIGVGGVLENLGRLDCFCRCCSNGRNLDQWRSL